MTRWQAVVFTCFFSAFFISLLDICAPKAPAQSPLLEHKRPNAVEPTFDS